MMRPQIAMTAIMARPKMQPGNGGGGFGLGYATGGLHSSKNDNPPGERTKKGHEGMRPRMALLCAGFTGDDQSPMSPDWLSNVFITRRRITRIRNPL
jgi:hypothetical protein